MLIRDFTLICADYASVVQNIIDIYTKGNIKTQVRYGFLELDITKPVLEGSKINNLILWAPENHPYGTILYGDQRDGFDWIGYKLSSKYDMSLIRVSLTLDLNNDVEHLAEFRQFMYYQPDGKCRLVRVMWDGRWQFYEEGERLPFEQTEKYEERIRKKRLTNDMILDYTEALGWDLRDPLCWTSKEDACYITKGVD